MVNQMMLPCAPTRKATQNLVGLRTVANNLTIYEQTKWYCVKSIMYHRTLIGDYFIPDFTMSS